MKICFCGKKVMDFEKHFEFYHRNRCLCGVEVADREQLINHAQGKLHVKGGEDLLHLIVAIVARKTKTKKMKDFLEVYRLGVS